MEGGHSHVDEITVTCDCDDNCDDDDDDDDDDVDDVDFDDDPDDPDTDDDVDDVHQSLHRHHRHAWPWCQTARGEGSQTPLSQGPLSPGHEGNMQLAT